MTGRRVQPDAASPAREPSARIVIYSHDTFGLGHLTRSTRLARAALQAVPQSSVLMLSGSPAAHRFRFPAGLDYVKLPSVVKSGPDTYDARELHISRRRVRDMRSQLILDAIGFFRPHLLMVDNVPHGMKGELLPALSWLKQHRPTCRIHLNLRDVLDDPQTMRDSWQALGIPRTLREVYDAVHVFGDPRIFDAIGAYDLPVDRSAYLHYIAPAAEERAALTPLPAADPARRRVLVTIGGGGDGEGILRAVADLQRMLGADSPYHFDIVTGPLPERSARHRIASAFVGLRGVSLQEYVENLPGWMAACDVVLSMGGYNTLCEILTVAPRSVVVPRVSPRREQWIRAQAFAALGLLRVVAPDELDAHSLDRALRASLESKPALPASGRVALDGIEQFKARLTGWMHPAASRATGETSAASQRRDGGTDGAAVARPIDRAEARAASRRACTETRRASLRAFRRTLLRHRSPGSLLALLMLMGAAPALAASDPFAPEQVRVAATLGYDSNLLDASDAERAAFESHDPGTFFVVDRMQDGLWGARVDATWTLGRLLGARTKLGLDYERLQYMHNPIRSASSYGLQLQARLRPGTRAALEIDLCPQAYARHRIDKDAVPGAPRYRAETHRRWDAAIAVRQALSATLELESTLEASWRRYAEAFRERDRVQTGVFLGAGWQAATAFDLGLEAGFRQSRSRNRPDLGSDLSFHEWRLGPQVQWRAPAIATTFSVVLEARWRDYRSDDPEDWNHFERTDRMGELRVGAQRALSPSLSLAFTYSASRRTARLGSDATIDYDEEGSLSGAIATTTLEWVWPSREE